MSKASGAVIPKPKTQRESQPRMFVGPKDTDPDDVLLVTWEGIPHDAPPVPPETARRIVRAEEQRTEALAANAAARRKVARARARNKAVVAERRDAKKAVRRAVQTEKWTGGIGAALEEAAAAADDAADGAAPGGR